MKKYNFKYILAVAALSVFATSCSEDEDATKERVVKPVVTASQTSFSVTEGETVTIDLTTDTRYFRTMDYKLELVGGTGSFRDFTSTGTETILDDGWGIIGHKITFPAYAETASFDVTPILDLLPEGAETLVFRLYPMGNSNGLIDEASETIEVVTTLDIDESNFILTCKKRSYEVTGFKKYVIE